jgi:hypothetical protein
MSDKLVAATGYNAGKRRHRQNGCSGTHTIIGYLLLAIGYCIRASGENAARFDVCSARYYALAGPLPRKAAD